MQTHPSFKNGLLSLLLVLVAALAWAQEQPVQTVRIAVLPFAMHTPSDLLYLQDGIRDMLASRLAWKGKVQVVDRAAMDQALKGKKASLSPDEAVSLAKSVKADYVLFGSLTGSGQAISIDANLAPTQGSGEPVNLHTQTRNLDEVIPRINQFAEEINSKVFGRSAAPAQAAAQAETAATVNPELLVPQTMLPGSKISYLNPNFLEVTPEAALHQTGLWRSQTLREGIVGMDIGDVDGDGRQEVVTVSQEKVTVFQRQESALKTMANFSGNNMQRFLWVSLADSNRDGKDEIYVTSLRRHNLFGNTSDSIVQGANVTWVISSFVLNYRDGKLAVVCDKQPYFLNALAFPKKSKMLLGQEMGSDRSLKPVIYEMQLQGQSLKQLATVPVPPRCNVYNFMKADINDDGADEVIVIDKENRMFVLSTSGEQLWKSSSRFGATTNCLEGKSEDRRYDMYESICIPSPILISDLNQDGILEIIVNDNLGQGRFLPEGLKIYDKGQITSLSWGQLGLVENWKTTEISGMVTAFRLGDLNRDGTPELIGSLVMAKDFAEIWKSNSIVFSYDLNISQNKAANRP
jgi:TolB-like protein